MRNVYISLQGMPVIHRVNTRRTKTDEVGDVINDNTYVEQDTKLIVDLSAYYRVLAAYNNASNENSMRLKCPTYTDYQIMAGDRILFTHRVAAAIQEDKEWMVSDVQMQDHGIVISKFVLLTPLRDV